MNFLKLYVEVAGNSFVQCIVGVSNSSVERFSFILLT